MTIDTLATWHQLVQNRSTRGLDALLDDSVIFYSPVVHTPQRGKAITVQYLTAAFRVFSEGSFRYVRELTGDRDAVLEFHAEIEGTIINGVDIITWDDTGKIVEFKVMIRTIKAIKWMQQKMESLFQADQPSPAPEA